MMGTFATVLAKSRIHTWEDRYHADVYGDIEAVNGVLKIVRIRVHYTLKVADDKRAAAEEAFEIYMPHCPAAMSVIDAIDISHDINYEAL
jgi:uncharacterized OsmC-like protein